jgi:hypothetical protein
MQEIGLFFQHSDPFLFVISIVITEKEIKVWLLVDRAGITPWGSSNIDVPVVWALGGFAAVASLLIWSVGVGAPAACDIAFRVLSR